MFCTNCGHEFEGKFCSECGTPAQQAPQDVHTTPYPQAPLGEYKGSLCVLSIRHDSITIFKGFSKTETVVPLADISNAYYKKGVMGGFLCVRTRDTLCKPLATSFTSANDPLSVDFSSLDAQGFYQIYEFLQKVAEINDYPIPDAPLPAPKSAISRPAATLPKSSMRSISTAPIPAPKPMGKHDRIKENKRNGVACCPKCGSTSISAAKKGFGFGKAAIGAVATGGIGLLAGGIGANKTMVTCLNCGHKWKL